MLSRSCRLTIQDMEDVSHTDEVTAATLYEVVAYVVKVSVTNVRLDHQVKLMDFAKWLDRAESNQAESWAQC
jgi:hypothetical protein